MTQTYKFYRGFSTKSYESKGKGFVLYNVELIEEDLFNELFTIKGERLEMPDFGTRIPLLIFEPNDTQSADVLKEDVTAVISHDPRVNLVACDIVSSPDNHRLICVAKVRYIEFNVVKDLRIEIGSR
jgi:phage baseplate assembly protein W